MLSGFLDAALNRGEDLGDRAGGNAVKEPGRNMAADIDVAAVPHMGAESSCERFQDPLAFVFVHPNDAAPLWQAVVKTFAT